MAPIGAMAALPPLFRHGFAVTPSPEGKAFNFQNYNISSCFLQNFGL